MKIKDMPKIESPFVRKEINGQYVLTDEIAEGYEWVFEDDSVMAIEKLHGTNVSIIIENGAITMFFNRSQRIPFFSRGKKYLMEALLNSFDRGYMNLLEDGQHFGEVIGPKVNGNPYKLDEHLWIPFETFGQKHLKYKSWGKYPKDFKTISEWFKNDLLPLYSSMKGDREGYVEGIVFTHPDGRMAKLRCDMFDWFKGKRHGGYSKKDKVPKENKKMEIMELNKTELEDLKYLMDKVVDGTPFYALEISKAKYLLGRVKELKVAKGRKRE